MTQKEFTELTNLPVEQYETANAAYMACDMDKVEWAKHYLEIKDNPLYKATVDEAILCDKQQRLANEKIKEIEAMKEEQEELGAMMTAQIKEQDEKIYELAKFIADQAEEKYSRTLALKAAELMGDKEYLIYKLERGYYLSAMDKKKIAALVSFAADTMAELEESKDGVEPNDEEA